MLNVQAVISIVILSFVGFLTYQNQQLKHINEKLNESQTVLIADIKLLTDGTEASTKALNNLRTTVSQFRDDQREANLQIKLLGESDAIIKEYYIQPVPAAISRMLETRKTTSSSETGE